MPAATGALVVAFLRQAAISSESLKIACDALEGNGFIDCGAFPSDAAADAALLQAVNVLLK